jgi:excinuclease UvrABC nuclease subunit
VAAVRRVLEGHGEQLDARLQERQAAMVQALAFEQAARLQRQREALERALRGVRRLRAARHTDAVLAYPARRPGWVALWGVRGGRIAVEREVGRTAFDEAAAREFLGELAAAAPPRPPLPAALVDEMLLVRGWVEHHRAAVNVLELGDFIEGRESFAATAAALVERVRLSAAAGTDAGVPDPAADPEPSAEARSPAHA